jgi:hypothetical protein
VAVAAALSTLLLAACSSGPGSAGPGTSGARTSSTHAGSSSTSSTTVVSGTVPRTDAAGTVWLCRPGIANDPCTYALASTSVTATGAKKVQAGGAVGGKAVDCFYVYPTVSTERGSNSNLVVHIGEIGAAVEQASRFSQVCNVWAPMYRQRTAASLALGLGADPTADEVAYQSLLKGWTDYIEHYNDGRPIVFIGHSQGAATLIRLLRAVVDPNGSLRKRMVGAIILGGNVDVPVGQVVGGSFRHIRLCTSSHEAGCVTPIPRSLRSRRRTRCSAARDRV